MRAPSAAGARLMSGAARPMTRFIQYPFDKTKMTEVREWANGVGLKDLRAVKGVKDVELSFCPGEGWLAARYIFNDLDDMVAFGDSDGFKKAQEALANAPHQDSSRKAHEFKGFFLSEI